MSKTEGHENQSRQELKNKRNLLYKLFLKNPMYIRLAAEIKVLDDQLSQWPQRMS